MWPCRLPPRRRQWSAGVPDQSGHPCAPDATASRPVTSSTTPGATTTTTGRRGGRRRAPSIPGRWTRRRCCRSPAGRERKPSPFQYFACKYKSKARIAISGPINYYIFHLNHFNYFTSSKFIPLNYLKFPSKFSIVSLYRNVSLHRISSYFITISFHSNLSFHVLSLIVFLASVSIPLTWLG